MPLKLSQQHERKRKHWRREKGKKKTNMNRALKVVMHTNYKFGLKGNPLLIQLYLMYQYTVIASLLLYCESQKGLVRVLWHISAYNSTAEMSEKIMKLVLCSCWLFEVQFYSYSLLVHFPSSSLIFWWNFYFCAIFSLKTSLSMDPYSRWSKKEKPFSYKDRLSNRSKLSTLLLR